MSELVARDDAHLSPVNDDRAYSGANGESYHDWYIRHNDFSPESDEASPLSVVPGNEDEPRQESQYDLSPVSDIDHEAPPTPEYCNEEQYLLAHPKLTEGVQRLSAFGTLYTPVPDDHDPMTNRSRRRSRSRRSKHHMFLGFGLSTVAPKQNLQTAPQTIARRRKKK
jgi:hypothetical protein